VDALLSLPVILVAVALAAIMGRGIVALASILAFTGWASYTRVLRGEALTLRDSGFVLAARSIGATTSHILRRSVLPNTVSTITVMTTFSIARFILIESSVSFLGMGITPPASSWGTMVGEGREYIFEAPWVSALPGLMIVVTVMAINFLGDGLRDRWDPHSRTM
jgi:peptide/nickel transport system permease protein